ncbi:MAG: PilZ domain-containing protein [Bdellovibrionales bacterium]|nr:PilZ domain-containing protein [Bdellovibrionales bacterium]
MNNYSKQPRFTAELPIKISGQSSIEGKIINISKSGAKIKLNSKSYRSLNTLLSFYIYMDGQTPETIKKDKKDIEAHRIKVISKIVRYANENNDDCLGVEIIAPEGEDKTRWNKFFHQLEQDQKRTFVEPKKLNFTLRFKNIRDLIDFLPVAPVDPFFIPTLKPRIVGTVVTITLMHPSRDDAKLDIRAKIIAYGTHPENEYLGATCQLEDLDVITKNKINAFVGQRLYPIMIRSSDTH